MSGRLWFFKRWRPRSLQARQLLAASVSLLAFLAIAGYALDAAFADTARANLRERLKNYATAYAAGIDFIAVTINVLVILGVMGILGATLTLPGIAGFVLTIGTAVDANVLIYERIREERRRGRNVVQAIEHGYKEASRTIFEANVTHAIAGGIMLALGSGPVKGFAIVLLIGIATSVFTAVTFTRLLASRWVRAKRPTEITI